MAARVGDVMASGGVACTRTPVIEGGRRIRLRDAACVATTTADEDGGEM